MVGSPKTLADLRRIEGQVQVTCRSCKAKQVWELNELIEEVRRVGGNTDWRTAPGVLECPDRCPAPLITLLPIPYGKQRDRRRKHQHALINLSLRILSEAVSRSAREAVGTIEVASR